MIQWVNKRYPQNAKDQYRLSPNELIRHKEIETVFNKFDEDGSGSLDTGEVHNMLSKHGVHIRREELRDLFTLIGKRPTTELSLEQFKELCFSRQANLRFHELVGLARKERAEENAKTYIPFSFNSLLEHMCGRAKREKIRD